MTPSNAARLDALLREADARWPVMAILNLTPDSFSDGGRHEADAVADGEALVAAGAAILDIGGESTRPGFTPVPAEEEWRRIGPTVEVLADRLSVPLSIDTTKPEVARRALARGAAIVNDIWGFQGDPMMAEVVAAHDAGAVLMHNRDGIDSALDIVEDMLRFFERSLAVAERAGVARRRLVLDPGIGFGKTQGQQIDALRAIGRLRAAFGLPVLVGLSKKRFLGHITGAPVERRGIETVAANLAAAAAGATLFRVHDVAEHVAALEVFGAIHRAGGGAVTDEVEVAFSLGSNLGDKADNVARAVRLLGEAGITRNLLLSSLYRTPPWGGVPQDWYVNACAVGTTALPALDLLRRVKAAEVALGRVESVRWGPRVIDIDILYRAEDVVQAPGLVLPHAEMMNRGFVLVPLAELRPERLIRGVRVADAAARADRDGIERL